MTSTILITGSNRGIGLELVRTFADRNWHVLACCRRPHQAVELSAIAEESGGRVAIHPLDVADSEQIRSLVETCGDRSIDILFNNAGIAGPSPQRFGPIDTGEWLETLRINTLAPYHMAVAFVEQVARSRRRIIATIGSQLGSIADNTSGGRYAYRTSKAAVHMVMKGLAVDLADRRITSVALHPGWVKTNIGGPQAPVSPAESAAGLYRVLATLTPEDSGKLWSWDGSQLPW
jgi:NAD(P)-dependent dehydrogenase (short-subunit alcohol dehydrogenase family)